LNTVKKGISIVGMGYVGLCTAVGFATKGYKVITSTHNPEKAKSINKGIPPFYEPNLQKSLQETIESRHLRCILDRKEAILNTDVTFIATATPSQPNGEINLQYIKNSVREIGKALNEKNTYHLVVLKSTVVPGTTQNMVKPILEKHSGKICGTDFGLCMNPEFLREGSALYDTLQPDRIIIGEHDVKSGETLETLYREFFGRETPPTVRTNLQTAELIKYANNTFLATKISFINTIANICEKIPGVDITTVAEGIGLDRRINPRFLRAGLGYGGSCFPKDVKALIAFAHRLGYTPTMLQAVRKVNDEQGRRIVERAKEKLTELKGKRISILGLAFKPNTDDMREARSIPVINQLLKEGANVTAYDPVAIPNAKIILKDKIRYAPSSIECLKDADCCIIVTEWDEFKKLKPENFTENMHSPILIDGRRIYNPEEFGKRLRFEAVGLGQSPKKPSERNRTPFRKSG
jgi:UDPglucose 6-dehydrogenase